MLRIKTILLSLMLRNSRTFPSTYLTKLYVTQSLAIASKFVTFVINVLVSEICQNFSNNVQYTVHMCTVPCTHVYCVQRTCTVKVTFINFRYCVPYIVYTVLQLCSIFIFCIIIYCTYRMYNQYCMTCNYISNLNNLKKLKLRQVWLFQFIETFKATVSNNKMCKCYILVILPISFHLANLIQFTL